ncbi:MULTISPECIES: hypothetical protein [Streptomyces]|uniref:Uncharacterized protein n=1 Tax=Streptomyces dengpaensis TaxID=2049881 RepID=A0ABM6SW98_9ACTN|nr:MULTISPECIES: hypothetical protein [Streptomyces]AVH59023.1 hypothetical protein C4B68_28365 [Streptomyces dengpaensis]PIB05950.1 hypothetical protein B1C81_26900 [Streptomyces sp. HG99]
MNDASTTEPPATNAQGTQGNEGHGRHRGPVVGRDDAARPQGRHRKPSGQGDRRDENGQFGQGSTA